LSAVSFNYQPCTEVNEVYDVTTDWLLAPKFFS